MWCSYVRGGGELILKISFLHSPKWFLILIIISSAAFFSHIHFLLLFFFTACETIYFFFIKFFLLFTKLSTHTENFFLLHTILSMLSIIIVFFILQKFFISMWNHMIAATRHANVRNFPSFLSHLALQEFVDSLTSVILLWRYQNSTQKNMRRWHTRDGTAETTDSLLTFCHRDFFSANFMNKCIFFFLISYSLY